MRRRWWKPWQREDEFGFSEGLSAGWQLTLVVAGIFAFGLLMYWINDMHMQSLMNTMRMPMR